MTRKFSAGGVVYRITGETILWLVTKPRPSLAFPNERFTLPKGEIEKNETPQETAVREVKEESGIEAKAVKKIDYGKSFYEIDGEKIFKVTTYFLMEYVSGEPRENEEVEEIFWLPLGEAKGKLSYGNEKKILQKGFELIE
jgi:8-oxo-dGTP pyrophosphatase MutT (NUDIX family)